jgi:CRP-like cAMP-binding protein
MPKTRSSASGIGPAVRARDPWLPSAGRMHQLLSDEERARLALLASIVRFKKGEPIYEAGASADAVFNIVTGVVTTYRRARDGEHIVAFLLADDLFGLAIEGRYINSARALTPATAYRIPLAALRNRLPRDADLEFHVICKLCEELRQAQRHAFLLSQRSAATKLAMFLQLLEQLQLARGEPATEIYLPMVRSDIAEYIGITLAAVSRAFRRLFIDGVIRVRNRSHVRIVDRAAFEELAGEPIATSARAPHTT